MVIKNEELLLVPPCEACKLLGQASQSNKQVLLLVTISPNPEWLDYAEMLPDEQYYKLRSIHSRASIYNSLNRLFGSTCFHLSTHFEFNRNGQLHTHSIFTIPESHNYDRNLMAISKIYHKVIGLKYNRSSICCDVRRITDEDVYKYLNKENIYEPIHHTTLVHYMKQVKPPKEQRIDDSGDESDIDE